MKLKILGTPTYKIIRLKNDNGQISERLIWSGVEEILPTASTTTPPSQEQVPQVVQYANVSEDFS